jgi:ferredoxin
MLLDDSTPATVGVDRELCQTAAVCLAYNIYELDDEAKAVLLTQNGQNSDDLTNVMATRDGYVAISDLVNPTSSTLEEMQAMVLESAKACPFNAIIVKNTSGEIIWPK